MKTAILCIVLISNISQAYWTTKFGELTNAEYSELKPITNKSLKASPFYKRFFDIMLEVRNISEKNPNFLLEDGSYDQKSKPQCLDYDKKLNALGKDCSASKRTIECQQIFDYFLKSTAVRLGNSQCRLLTDKAN